MDTILKSKKNLITLTTLVVMAVAIPIVMYLVQTVQVFKPRAGGEPIMFSGPNVIVRNGTQKLKLDDKGKATVGLQLTSPIGPPVNTVVPNPPPVTPPPPGGVTPPPPAGNNPPPASSGLDKRVFVTSQTYDGNLGSLTGADAKCQARANAANLGGTWKAWISTVGVNAKDRISDGRYVRLDGQPVADNKAHLTSVRDFNSRGLYNPIDITETRQVYSSRFTGNVTGSPEVWTGTEYDGTKMIGTYSDGTSGVIDCNGWTNGAGAGVIHQGMTGLSSGYLGPGWTRSMFGSSSLCNQQAALYCFEQ